MIDIATIATSWGGHHMDGGGWWFAMSLMLLLCVLAVALVVGLLTRGGSHRSGLADARAVLADRLARGEIEPDEYRDRLQHLR